MKKILFLTTVIVTTIGFSAAQTFSAVTPSGHTLWYFVKNQNLHTVEVTWLNDYRFDTYSLSGTLVIPDSISYNGVSYAVSAIRDGYGFTYGVFRNNTQLTSVVLPNTMDYIGIEAFRGCSGLISVTISNTLTSINDRAFYDCSGLTSITIPSSVTSVGAEAFRGCTSLSSLTLNANAPIANQEFQGCTSLTNVVIPNGVTSIGQSAFSGCTNLTSISIPNSVTTIGTSAFYGCHSLQNLVLPNTLQGIMSNMCCGCSALENVTIPNSVAYIQTGAFEWCTHLFNVTVPNSVLSIETNAFNGVWNVTYNGTATGASWGAACVNGYVEDSILYNDSTKNVLIRALWDIHSANIPSTVTSIGDGAFHNCSNINSLTIGNNVQTIGYRAFYGCSSITSLNIDNNVQSIGDYAFENCTGLTTVTFNTAATAMGIFFGCITLSDVTLGDNVTTISDEMFSYCYNLNTLSLTSNIQTIGMGAIQNTNLSTFTIPLACISIGDYAFNGSPINTVTALPTTPPTIGSHVFPSYPIIEVPCGQGSAYRSSWYQYSSLITEPTVDFALNVLASEGGHAYATSEISCVDSTATISAENDYGYHFDHWSDGNTDNPRNIHVTSDTTVTAIFARNNYTITLNSSDEAMGSTTGGGTYLYGDTVSLMAVPVDHYHFMRWRTDYYGYEYSLNENPLEMVVTEDRILTADFAIDTYYVNVIPNEVARGSVTGGGYFEYGSPVTVSASAYSGYQFVRWSNGAEYNPYTFAATNDMTLEAVFMEEGTVYHVEATSDNSVMGTVTGGGPYATGETAILTAVAYPGYHFVRWQDDVTDNPRTITVTQDATFVAYFEANVGIENISDTGIIVYAKDFQIHIDEAFGKRITVYSIDGRIIASLPKATEHVAIPVTSAGIFIVKIGNHPARKIVVVR